MFQSVLRVLLVLGTGCGVHAVAADGAAAGEVRGLWLRDNGNSKVQIAPCGGAICGTVVWVRNPAHRDGIGTRVFFDMVPDKADAWSGKAFNPEDGRTYSGTMILSGDTLTTSGCVLGGLICKSVTWSRAD